MKFDVLLNFEDVLSTYKSTEAGVKALSKYSYWFPLRESPSLAGIVADLMGDGHLQDYPKLRLDYTSKSIDELNRFNTEVYNVFGVKGKIRKCNTNHYGTLNLGINSKPLVRVLKLIGVPTGSKVLTKFSIPKWILEDRILLSRFINRLFSCEGSVDLKSKYLEIQMYKAEHLIENGILFFKEIKFYLDAYFDIKTTEPFTGNTFNLRCDRVKTRPIRLKIKQMNSLLKFKNLVGMEDSAKMKRLNVITESNLNKMQILT
ncbi:hypothetical protein HYV80_02050 [Candidatus Woesearchaeota archaeon]|nr:hypothetical protein [Candidatus Woesearchaeota archaeon]